MCPIAYAIVTTANPNASATPTNPIPDCGKAASNTAAPHPPNTSQNVPRNSAASFFDRGMERILSRWTNNNWAGAQRRIYVLAGILLNGALEHKNAASSTSSIDLSR
jgi:hypothetical protein